MNETRIKEVIELIAKFWGERDWKQFRDPEEYCGRAVDRDERNHFQIRPTNSLMFAVPDKIRNECVIWKVKGSILITAAHSLEWQLKR